MALKATVLPAEADDKTLKWETTDGETATVKNGTVTGVKPGKVTIKAITNDGGIVGESTVTVKEPVVEPEETE